MTLEIKPLNKALGAEVTGLDLSRALDEETVDAIYEAFLDYHLLCIRSGPLAPEDFKRLSTAFGDPKIQLLRDKRHGEIPEVSVLESTYKSAEAKPDDLTLVRLSGWHTDDSYFEEPAKATLLQALEIPSSGGETRFCNLRKAWEDLPGDEKAELEGLHAVHSYDTPRAAARAATRTTDEAAETPDVVHPLIRLHEDTGNLAIYLNPNRTDHIEGWDRDESDALLDRLTAHITKQKYRYDHEWQVGDILLWDNRCLIHSVNTDYPVGETRRHQRILLEGSRPE